VVKRRLRRQSISFSNTTGDFLRTEDSLDFKLRPEQSAFIRVPASDALLLCGMRIFFAGYGKNTTIAWP
jgi:hypothetical protein